MSFIQKWKEEWWKRKSSQLEKDFEKLKNELEQKFEFEIETLKISRESLVRKLQVEEEELGYRLKVTESKIDEVKRRDNELKEQIRLIEAKASPSNVWAESFTSGFNKAWDMMQPIMLGGVSKLKDKIYEDAVNETLRRMKLGDYKKNN